MRGTYDWHKYYDEKKLAFEKLATLIENIVDPKECAANEGKKAAHLIFNDGSAWAYVDKINTSGLSPLRRSSRGQHSLDQCLRKSSPNENTKPATFRDDC